MDLILLKTQITKHLSEVMISSLTRRDANTVTFDSLTGMLVGGQAHFGAGKEGINYS